MHNDARCPRRQQIGCILLWHEEEYLVFRLSTKEGRKSLMGKYLQTHGRWKVKILNTQKFPTEKEKHKQSNRKMGRDLADFSQEEKLKEPINMWRNWSTFLFFKKFITLAKMKEWLVKIRKIRHSCTLLVEIWIAAMFWENNLARSKLKYLFPLTQKWHCWGSIL